MSKQEDAEPPKQVTEKSPSGTNENPEEEYDPYKYRTGHISTSIAFFLLVKSSIGSGILLMPFGFKNAGMIGGFIVGTLVAIFVIFCFLVLINTMNNVARELKVPHVTLQEASSYAMHHSYERMAKYSKAFEGIIDAMFILNYVGTGASYYNYIIICTLTLAGYKHYAEGAVNLHRAAVAGIWFVPLVAVNCVRSLRTMGPISIAGNGLIMSSMAVVLYFIFCPDEKGFSSTWTYFADFDTTPLFVGMMIFSIGSIGVGIAIERDMKDSRRFVGWFGIFNISMTIVVIFYFLIACMGYWKFGEDTKSTIVLTLSSEKAYWLVVTVQVAVGLALFFSYPLMCFVLFDLIWFRKIIPKLEEKNVGTKRQLMWEYMFRLGVTALTGVVALLVPRLDVTLSLIGALSLGFLSLIMPGILEFNFTYGKHRWTKPLILYKDIFIMVVGFLCLIIGTYSAVYSLIVESLKRHSPDDTNSTSVEKFYDTGSPPRAASAARKASSEQPGETYNPYKFRTFGHISDFYAFLHLVKASFGTGVLTFPYGFKNAGMILGFVIGIVTSMFLIYCFHMLIKNMMRIAADQQVPYISFGEAVKLSFNAAGEKCSALAKYSSVFIDIIIALYHFGICTAYVVYLVTSCLTITNNKQYAEGGVNVVRTILTLVWVIPLFMINCLRDLKLLMPVSLLGNITTMGSMLVIVYYILRPDDAGFSKDWQYVGTFEKAPLFIGTVLFAVESFGVIVAIEKDMEKPKHFRGLFGVFNISMTVVVIWYLFIGAMGYWKYGDSKIATTIVLTIPPDEHLAIALQVTMGVALYCSYPLQCYVVFEVIWKTYLEPKVQKRKLLWEIAFRFAITLATGLIGLTIPKLDLIVSLIGCVCITFLGIIIPGLLEYNYSFGKYKWGKPAVLIKDIIIMALGILAFVIGTYSSIYGIIKESLGSSE